MSHQVMGSKGLVWIVRDVVHDPLLAQISADLSAAGATVQRGAFADVPPEQRDFVKVLLTTIRHPVGPTEFDLMPALQGVVVPTSGLESVDTESARQRSIEVASGTPGPSAVSMAEATIMLVLAGLYRLLPAVDAMRHLQPVEPFSAHMLQGRTVGLVGWGRIAHAMVPRLAAFDVNILVSSSRHAVSVEAPAAQVSLDELLSRSDVVCLTAALRADTRHLLAHEQLQAMKPGSILVNTARGALVDEAALLTALQEGPMAAALLDTFENEPLPADHPLRRLANVVLTPHCIGHTQETAQALRVAAVDNVLRILHRSRPKKS